MPTSKIVGTITPMATIKNSNQSYMETISVVDQRQINKESTPILKKPTTTYHTWKLQLWQIRNKSIYINKASYNHRKNIKL